MLRLLNPEGPNHIIIRANNGRTLFSSAREYRMMLFLMDAAAEKHGVRVHVLTLMSNHLHTMATPSRAEATAKWVHSFSRTYSFWRNRRRGCSGSLFDRQYESVPIESEAQLALCTAYIEINPVKDGLVKHPGDWPWSTYNLHMGLPCKVPARMWTPTPWAAAIGREAYARFLEERAEWHRAAKAGLVNAIKK